ncbi:MAG: hypothetical protein WEB88_01885 [Gemmatimonadota bacterium]
MALLATAYIALIFLFPLALSGWVGFRSLPWGKRCPHCGGDSLLLADGALRLASTMLRRVVVQRRWCLACGWEGAVRCLPARSATMAAAAPAPEPDTQEPRAPSAPHSDGVDLRWLDVDGSAWRVRLEFWERTGQCFGRFVFLGPDGRRCTDAVRSFAGRTRSEVVGQALSLSEGSLAHRLRHLVTE